MLLQRVTGVLWWRVGTSHYKALFRRARGDERKNGFTKDFLQASGTLPALHEMFGGREPPYDGLVYRWPSGAYTYGRIYPASDFEKNGRVEVGQFLGGVPPEPWRIGDPESNPLITIPGDPSAAIPDAATAQWRERIEPLGPWLVMIQLNGDQRHLDIRAYLENPPAGLERASLEHVPRRLRDVMTANRRAGAGAVAGGDVPDLWFDPDDLRNPWSVERERAGASRTVPLISVRPAYFGVTYRTADEQLESAAPDPFDIDPNNRDRATRAHNKAQNELANVVRARGAEPQSPAGEPDFDLAWEEPDGTVVVAEVKSVTANNAERQLRLGLGQVLRYRNLLEATARPVRALLLLTDAPPDSRWVALCRELDVGLLWLPNIEDALEKWLARLSS